MNTHLISVFALLWMSPAPASEDTLQWPAVLPADEAYLRGVAAETWACIAHFVEPKTGLPYDSSERAEHTSVTNIGYYAACTAVAAEMKLVPRDEAVVRVRRVVDAYSRFKHWHGFSQSWNNVHTLAPSPSDTMISLLDSGNMVAGLVVARQLMPEVRDAIDAVLAAMDWKPFYDAADGRLFGGYDMARDRIDSGWHIGDYAGDGRMAAFWAIAVGAAPPESWDKLNRETEMHYGLTMFKPAWLGGGLFMQAQDAIFLDEWNTPAGKSAADFAYAQMLYALDLKLPAWGWSACSAPDGQYLGWGGRKVSVVTPHAAGMAAQWYPHQAAECLRKLETLGARAPFEERGEEYKLGFRDSVDLSTKAVCARYLPPLDQAMMFLALANVLEDRIVQRAFMENPTVQQGRARIAEYQRPPDPAWLAELRRRDREPLRLPPRSAATGPSRVLIDDFQGDTPDRNRLGDVNDAWTRDAKDDTVSVRMSLADAPGPGHTGTCLRVDYDVDSPNAAYGGITLNLNRVNAGGCNALSMRVRGTPGQCKVELHGRGGSGATHVRGVKTDEWQTVQVPFIDFGGMITDWGEMHRLVLVVEDRLAGPKTGTLWLDDVELIAGPTRD